MVYKVIVPKKAQKELEKIDSRYKPRILIALKILSGNPFLGKNLNGEYGGQRSYRVWPYRIIYEIHKNELLILIIQIRHRQGAYK